MGWINQTKAAGAKRDAQHAWDSGRRLFVYKFIEATTNSMSTTAMTGINDQMEEIESVGWTLEHMSVGEGKALTSERLAVVCVYRRLR